MCGAKTQPDHQSHQVKGWLNLFLGLVLGAIAWGKVMRLDLSESLDCLQNTSTILYNFVGGYTSWMLQFVCRLDVAVCLQFGC